MAFKYLKNTTGSDVTIGSQTFTNAVNTDMTTDDQYLCDNIYKLVTDIDSGDFDCIDEDGTTILPDTDGKEYINLRVNVFENRNTYGQ